MHSSNRFSARMGRLAACIAMGTLLFTAQDALAQEPPEGTQPAGYQFELSGAPDEAFPVTLQVAFENGNAEVIAYQNGTVDLDAQYGRIISVEGDSPGEGGSWFVNDPPGPNRPPGKYPGPVRWNLCLYTWYTWIQFPPYYRWIQLLHMQYAPC